LNTVEDLFTQNTGKYFLLNTVGIFIYTKYLEILSVEDWEDLFTPNTEKYLMLSTVGRLFTQNTGEILSVEYCRKIFMHKVMENTLC